MPANKFQDCERFYQNRLNIQLAESQICAGGGRRKEGPCANDSGGPLMALRSERYTVIGIISSGYNICGANDTNINYIPMISTRIESYELWIKGYTQKVET